MQNKPNSNACVFSVFSIFCAPCVKKSVYIRTTIFQLLVFYARFFNLNFLISYLIRGYIESLKHQLLSFFVFYSCQFVIQSCISLFFMRVFHAAIFVSPFISTAEADINAVANFCPLAVKIYRFSFATFLTKPWTRSSFIRRVVRPEYLFC